MLLAGRWWWQWTGPSSGTIPTSTMSSSPELLRYFLVPLQYHLPLLVCPTNKCKLDRLSSFLAPTALCIPWSAATVCLFTHLLYVVSMRMIPTHATQQNSSHWNWRNFAKLFGSNRLSLMSLCFINLLDILHSSKFASKNKP